MTIKYYKHVKRENILSGIKELLTLCDSEFVPPLSQRNSTTQSFLKGQEAESRIPEEYFEALSRQEAFVALEGRKVIGFMSFKRNYICREISPEYLPNLYITTVIVHPMCRNRGVTNQFYETLLNKFREYHIFTRTWSTNYSHTRILLSHRFFEHRRIKDDRGDGIDTVYYHYSPASQTKRQIIKQYRLTGNFIFLALLVILTALFLTSWLLTGDGVLHELSIAVATSLIASALCLLSDSVLKYRESKNDEYINTLKSFGIENLQFYKDELLESIIPNASEELWISGYRLIMTAKVSFRKAICACCKNSRDLKIKVLTVAPWSETFRLVYGNEDVTDNYFKVFYDLCQCASEYGTELEIRMTEKPIFNDTYKVDERFITGPYLHCTDSHNNKITARDFFSLDITDRRKELYNIIYKDYMAVWDTAGVRVDTEGFYEACRGAASTEAGREEKLAFLKSWCVKI